MRIFMQAHFGWDDAFAVACLVCYANVQASRAFADILLKASFSALSAAVLYGTSVAIGKHLHDLTTETIVQGLKVRTSISRENTATDLKPGLLHLRTALRHIHLPHQGVILHLPTSNNERATSNLRHLRCHDNHGDLQHILPRLDPDPMPTSGISMGAVPWPCEGKMQRSSIHG